MAGTDDIPRMTLWYCPNLRPIRCVWMIYELGIENKVDFKFMPVWDPQDPRRAEFAKNVNSCNTVPVLRVEGGPTLLESGAICLYLADLCGRLAPEPKDRAEYYDWVLFAASRLDEALEVLGQQWWYGPKEKRDPEVVTKGKVVVGVCLDRVEKALADRQFILGDQLTAADCVLIFNLMWAGHSEMNQGELLQGRPNIQAYVKRIQARPAFIQASALPNE